MFGGFRFLFQRYPLPVALLPFALSPLSPFCFPVVLFHVQPQLKLACLRWKAKVIVAALEPETRLQLGRVPFEIRGHGNGESHRRAPLENRDFAF